MNIQTRTDRIGQYLQGRLENFVFVELSEGFMMNSDAGDLMKGVQIPLKREEVKTFADGSGVSFATLAENMSQVMGCDPHFEYVKDYVAILDKMFGEKFAEGITKVGNEEAEEEKLEDACVHFRAALCMNSEYLDAMYSYARVCRAMYNESEDLEYVGRFKAESQEWFEIITTVHPDFPEGFYYLGYSYINLGLYMKASLTWKEFLKIAPEGKERAEVTERLNMLEDPIEIEKGTNDIMSGRYNEGVRILAHYQMGRFKDWWPLHYYLGIGYTETGRLEEALESYKQVLRLNASHIDTMEEMIKIYNYLGDKDMAEKYTMKIELIKEIQAEGMKWE